MDVRQRYFQIFEINQRRNNKDNRKQIPSINSSRNIIYYTTEHIPLIVKHMNKKC